MKTFFIDRITVLAIIIPMIVLILIGYLSYENTIKFIQKNTFTDRTNLIIQKLEHLASTTSEAETGQRGFIITGRPSYLSPYYSAIGDVHEQIRSLGTLISNDTIKEKLKPLTTLIDGKLAELNETIVLRQSHGINGVLPIILSDKGRILMGKIRTILSDIQRQENNLLSNELQVSQADSKTTVYTILVASLIASGTAGISVYTINHRIHKRHLDVQKSLETEVKNRTEELQNTNNKLIIANRAIVTTERAKEEFISMISHELKTPLVPLKGYAQILLRPKIMGEVNARQKNAIEAMSRNIEKLQVLVDDVMDVYKLDIGKLSFQ